MFDFRKLDVYNFAKDQNISINQFLDTTSKLDRFIEDQLRRASLSIVLNIAEGSGRITPKDRRRFYVISRGSVYECVAILEIIYDRKLINREEFKKFIDKFTLISKMLYGLIKSSTKKQGSYLNE